MTTKSFKHVADEYRYTTNVTTNAATNPTANATTNAVTDATTNATTNDATDATTNATTDPTLNKAAKWPKKIYRVCPTIIALIIVYAIASVIYCCERCNGSQSVIEAIHTENVRNVIFVGRSRTGKTTSIEVLKNKDYNPGLSTVFAGTKNATLHSFNNSGIRFKIMDTPGLFERALTITDKKTNSIILGVIKKCIEDKIDKINHVYFFMTIQQGLYHEDLKAFKLFTDLFVGMENKMSIVIGRAQEIKNTTFYIEQFKSVPVLKPLYKKGNQRIFFLGAIQQGPMVNITKMKKKVYPQREKLLKHITEQNTAYDVKQLKVYKDAFPGWFRLMMGFVDNYIWCWNECSNNKHSKKQITDQKEL